MKIVDLSVPIVDDLPVDPPRQVAHIKYIDHKEGVQTLLDTFPGSTVDDLPDGCAWACDEIFLTTHTGTHMDAPYHYHPTMNGGERAWTIDEVPLEWCIGDGVMVDFSHKPDGHVCSSAEFQEYFDQVGYTPKAGDILLLHTSAMEAWGGPEYMMKGCGVGREATLWLTSLGIRVMGTDAWSWDAPLGLVARKYSQTHDASLIWEGHKAGMDTIYCHMEKLNNLDKLPPTGFKVIALPINVERGTAGWVRPVAIFD